MKDEDQLISLKGRKKEKRRRRKQTRLDESRVGNDVDGRAVNRSDGLKLVRSIGDFAEIKTKIKHRFVCLMRCDVDLELLELADGATANTLRFSALQLVCHILLRVATKEEWDNDEFGVGSCGDERTLVATHENRGSWLEIPLVDCLLGRLIDDLERNVILCGHSSGPDARVFASAIAQRRRRSGKQR